MGRHANLYPVYLFTGSDIPFPTSKGWNERNARNYFPLAVLQFPHSSFPYIWHITSISHPLPKYVLLMNAHDAAKCLPD
jgi:hypothetical protein